MFKKFFGASSENPLLNAKETRQFLDSLNHREPLYTLAEVAHWLQLLNKTEEIKPKQRFSLATRLNQAAQPAVRKLLAEYVQTSRMHKVREEAIWNACSDFFQAVYNAYTRLVAEAVQRGGSAINEETALSGVRAMRSIGMFAHLTRLRYRHPLPGQIWDMMYALFSLAEQRKFCRTGVTLNPGVSEQKTSLLMEMVKILMMEVSSPEQLTKSQMELARQVIEEFAPSFVWEDIPAGETIFFIDFSQRKPPTRLTHLANPHFMSRCFGPGNAVPALINAVKQLETGQIPKDVDIRRYPDYKREDLLEVFLHLSQAWSKITPQEERSHFDKRQFARRKIYSHFEVIHGLEDIHFSLRNFKLEPEKLPQEAIIDKLANDELVFDFASNKLRPAGAPDIKEPEVAIPPEREVSVEIWVAENVSETGYGLSIEALKQDWVQEKELIGFRKEFANWSVGVIKRVEVGSGSNTQVGIQLLSRTPEAVGISPIETELTVWETAGETFTLHHTLALLLRADPPLLAEDCLLLKRGTYDLHKTYELPSNQGRHLIRLDFVRQEFLHTDLVSFSVIDARNK